jgi:hypothetical protein
MTCLPKKLIRADCLNPAVQVTFSLFVGEKWYKILSNNIEFRSASFDIDFYRPGGFVAANAGGNNGFPEESAGSGYSALDFFCPISGLCCRPKILYRGIPPTTP